MTTITRLFGSIIWLTMMMVVLGGASQVSAQGGTLVWEDQVDGSGGDNAFFSEAAAVIAAEGSRVFAAGNLINLNTGGDFAVRAYDAATGALLWKDDADGDLAGSDSDEVIDIVANGNRVFAAGRLWNISRGGDFAVRAYDAATGTVLWKDNADGDLAGGYNLATAITALGNRVFAVGNLTNTITGRDIAVRAYDAATGALLWKDDVDGPQTGSPDLDWGCAVAAQGNMVFAAGTIGNTDNSSGLLVRAYDAASGRLLWQDQRAGRLPCSSFVLSTFTGINTMAVDGNHLVLAGSVENTSGGTDFLVRTYETNTGTFLWEDRVRDAGASLAVTIQGCRVYATGSLLRVYDAQNGSLLREISDRAGSLAVQGNLVATASSASGDFTVRAYNAETGTLLWDGNVGEVVEKGERRHHPEQFTSNCNALA